MLADLEARVAAVEPLRRKKRGAVFLRVAVVSLVVAFGLAAVVFVPFMALTSAAACCEDFLKVRAWLVVVIFLGSGLLTVAAAVGLGVLAYRAVGSPGSGYQARFGDEVVGPLLTSVFPGAAVDVSKGLARAELEATALFPPGLNYDTAFRVDGRVDGTAWAAGDVKAWKRVAGSAGSSDTTTLLTWLEGFLAWVGVPCPVSTPVLVVGESYIKTGVRMARRMDLLRGETGDPAFDAAFQVLVADTESAVPPLSGELRRALLELRERFGEHAYFAVTPTGVAIAVPVYGRMAQDSRRLLEPRTLAANEAGELEREAALLAEVPAAAERLARAAGAPPTA